MIRSARQAMASSTTEATGSTASGTRRTGAVGSPQTSPTASQSLAQAGSYMVSMTRTTSATVGIRDSVVTRRTLLVASGEIWDSHDRVRSVDYSQLHSSMIVHSR